MGPLVRSGEPDVLKLVHCLVRSARRTDFGLVVVAGQRTRVSPGLEVVGNHSQAAGASVVVHLILLSVVGSVGWVVATVLLVSHPLDVSPDFHACQHDERAEHHADGD